MWAGSSAWLERSTDNRKVAGSNPARPTPNTHSGGYDELPVAMSIVLCPDPRFFANLKKFDYSENLEYVLGAGQLLLVLGSRIAGCTVELEMGIVFCCGCKGGFS